VACLRTEGLGYEVFNVANPDRSVDIPTSQVIARFYSGVPVRGDLPGRATPYSIEKAKALVEFSPEICWHDKIG